MPMTDFECPHCDNVVHTDGLIEGYHALGCGQQFSGEWLRERGW